MGFHLALSTNGTLIDAGRLPAIVSIGYDYVGISLDGLQQTHDRFRRKPGAYEASLQAARLLRDARVRVGLRFTLTRENAHDLPALLDLIEREGIERFYLSHLNYAGRGNIHRDTDAQSRTTRAAMDLLFDTCWRLVEQGRPKEFVTGNNDADGVYLLQWLRRRFPDREEHLRAKLAQWGGNSSGVNVANIDNVGDVHPDSFWWDHTLGNVTRRRFGEIWADTGDPVMARLKASPRALGGRCGRCGYFDICGGNTRVRAMQLTGDPWAEDPGCYLQDDELCLEAT
jgi:heme d1 biosynthesis radical SAM protein NirJ